MTPHGPGHFINGLSMCDNVFRTVNATVDRIEGVDTTHATLDFTRFRNLMVEANSFNGIAQLTQSPVMVEHVQNTAAATWVVDAAAFLPFGGRARNVQSIVAEGAITTGGGAAVGEMPWVQVEQGPAGGQAHLRWSQPLRGRVKVTLRCDNPN
jgi:hypothetical protein